MNVVNDFDKVYAVIGLLMANLSFQGYEFYPSPSSSFAINVLGLAPATTMILAEPNVVNQTFQIGHHEVTFKFVQDAKVLTNSEGVNYAVHIIKILHIA